MTVGLMGSSMDLSGAERLGLNGGLHVLIAMMQVMLCLCCYEEVKQGTA